MIIVNIPYDFYFNPRSRGGSDVSVGYMVDSWEISIHAPAEGATCHDYNKGPLRFSISIHAPAEGATFRTCGILWRYDYFNPRSRGGSDRIDEVKKVSIGISIHAPAEGATLNRADRDWRSRVYFNPRSRGGSDCINFIYFSKSMISIHAPAEGATWHTHTTPTASMAFQSTLPRRERLFWSKTTK